MPDQQEPASGIRQNPEHRTDTVSRSRTNRTDFTHWAPHKHAAFEGWYSRFDIPSTGASVLFVICSVPSAPTRPHMLSLTYISPSGNPTYQQHLWPTHISQRSQQDSTWLFSATSPSRNTLGTLTASYTNPTTQISVQSPSYTLSAHTTSQSPFRPGISHSTPAGWMVHLPLPLHWHVHSLASRATISLRIQDAGIDLPPGTEAVAHQEKNWANSFQRAHMWLQGRRLSAMTSSGSGSGTDADDGAYLCVAGGRVYAWLDAYILTFRNADVDVWLRPPVTLGLLGVSPFLTKEIDWAGRRFALSARGWRTRIEIVARAPRESFFNLGAPFAEGHREKALAQSLDAVIEVRVWRREGWMGWLGLGRWVLVTTEVFQRAGLEFGGEYYGDAELRP